jgi:hypothetical protein
MKEKYVKIIWNITNHNIIKMSAIIKFTVLYGSHRKPIVIVCIVDESTPVSSIATMRVHCLFNCNHESTPVSSIAVSGCTQCYCVKSKGFLSAPIK